MRGPVNLKCAYLLTGYFRGLCFSPPCTTSFFAGRMNHVVKAVSFALAVTHPTFSSAYDELYQRVACCNTHTYVSSITLMTFGSPVAERLAVLASQMFFRFVVSERVVPAGSALSAAQAGLETRLSQCSCTIHLNDPGAHR